MTDRTKHFLTTDLIPIPKSVTINEGDFVTLEDGQELILQIPENAGSENVLNDDAFQFWKIRFAIRREALAETIPAEVMTLRSKQIKRSFSKLPTLPVPGLPCAPCVSSLCRNGV